MKIETISSSSKGNCHKVSDPKTSILLDCGLPIATIKKALNFSLSAISGVLLSHEHQDHAKAAKDILKVGVSVYCHPLTAESLDLRHHRLKTVPPNESFTIGTFIVQPFNVIHDVPNYGYIVTSTITDERLLFFTDAGDIGAVKGRYHYILAESNYCKSILANNVMDGVLDISLAKRIIKNHFSIQQLSVLLNDTDKSELKKVWLCHLSDRNSNADMAKKVIMEICGCEVVVA